MTPDEYDKILEELDQETIQADKVFEIETEEAYQKLQLAKINYHKVAGPAQLRYDAKIAKIEGKKERAYADMWEAHLERERQQQAFIMDLLSDPDPDKMKEKLLVKIEENNESS